VALEHTATADAALARPAALVGLTGSHTARRRRKGISIEAEIACVVRGSGGFVKLPLRRLISRVNSRVPPSDVVR